MVTRTEGHESICYPDDSRESEIAARKEFIEKRDSGGFPNIRLIVSNHWASEGWWIEWGDSALEPLKSKEDWDITQLIDKLPIFTKW